MAQKWCHGKNTTFSMLDAGLGELITLVHTKLASRNNIRLGTLADGRILRTRTCDEACTPHSQNVVQPYIDIISALAVVPCGSNQNKASLLSPERLGTQPICPCLQRDPEKFCFCRQNSAAPVNLNWKSSQKADDSSLSYDATPLADQFLFPMENKLFCMSKTIRALMTF